MKRKLVLIVVVAGAVLTMWMLFRHFGSYQALLHYEKRVRTFLSAHWAWGLAIGFLSYFLLSLIPGTGGKSVIYGWLFGFWQGFVIANCALTAAAVVTFLISRTLLREGLTSRFAVAMRRLDGIVERNGAFYVFALRMMHAPYTATNYALGATKIELKSFWWATQLGLVPGTIVFVFAGSQIPTLEEAVKQGASAVFSTPMIVALTLMGVFPLFIRWIMGKIWGRKTQIPTLPD